MHQGKVPFLSCLIRHIETSAAKKQKTKNKKNVGSSLEEAYQNRKAGVERAHECLQCVLTDVLPVVSFTQLWYRWVPSKSGEEKIKAR